MSHDTNTTVTPTHSAAEPTTNRPVVSPAVDIYENEREYLVLADLPGVAHESVQIRFEGGELSLAAARQEDKASDYLGSEIVVADYRRLFRIPETVDSDKIEAKLVDGVLHLVLPKSTKAGPRQISVKSN
ncbi:MAG: Hsp20/alpha crystallin family protein [Myxococcales bacterium]|nr:Hsp20/alpha crystallin family protein [Myxococcales bacterium]